MRYNLKPKPCHPSLQLSAYIILYPFYFRIHFYGFIVAGWWNKTFPYSWMLLKLFCGFFRIFWFIWYLDTSTSNREPLGTLFIEIYCACWTRWNKKKLLLFFCCFQMLLLLPSYNGVQRLSDAFHKSYQNAYKLSHSIQLSSHTLSFVFSSFPIQQFKFNNSAHPINSIHYYHSVVVYDH